MRPIALDMNGFASFRMPTRVNFADADFFALVGPTGSGKSTVIDAMTFALYGSVPRWGRKGMVSLALAPTTARGTVKLVFEAEGQRYVVARELRRVGGQVGQRAASLERILDPHGLAEPGENTEVLAKDRGVADAVEHLLGLSYEDFCQCVVLPQGQFAAFLHAKASERQEILLRLLGAEHYRQIMMRANQQASAAAQRADALDETLATFHDATQEAEDVAREAETALAALNERVDKALLQIHVAAEELANAEDEFARLEREKSALAAVRVPDGAASLDENLARTRADVEQALAAERLALDADADARQALASGPQRAPLELAQQRRKEQTECAARLPSVQEGAIRLARLARRADSEVADASAALEELRTQRDEAARKAEAAEQAVCDLSTAHATLTAVTVPEGVDLLDERARTADERLRDASRLLEAAESDDRQTRAALESAVGLGSLEQAVRDLSDLHGLTADLNEARAKLAQARRERESADAALESAESTRHDCQHRLDQTRRAHVAADLRTHLVAGQPCPVCDQAVTTLPAPLDAMAIEDARSELDRATAAVKTTQKRASAAVTAEARATQTLESLISQRARHITSLVAVQSGPLSGAGLTALADFLTHEPGSLTAAALDDPTTIDQEQPRVEQALTQVNVALHARHELDKTARTAASALGAARDRAKNAQDVLTAVENETDAARRALRTARDRVVGLGAPPVEDTGLAAAWTSLFTWAATLASALTTDLSNARPASQKAAQQLKASQTQFVEAENSLAQFRSHATTAAKQEQDAQTRLSELSGRINELDRLLRDAPDEAEVTVQLALRGQLEAAAADAEQRLLKARSDRSTAEQVLAALEQDESVARAQLSAARDPLVTLGAPALGDTSVLAAWTTLENWASREASFRGNAIVAANETVAAARSKAESLTARLSADLAASGLDLLPAAVPTTASREVAAAVERARAATARIVERRAQADDLLTKRDAAQEEQRVAKLLGDLLRSDRFQRWLVTAAVDALVDHASKNLAGLSAGQFDLTHEDGEFYVIDHADVDSRRSVRTLSGGETFQASLALALALSSQISALSVAGAARLDSIFLDEGFGTLDPDTLEVVATTLETLAQGERMVGVITHVTALAERVPVRFRVSRDTRTSTVVREGLPPTEGTA